MRIAATLEPAAEGRVRVLGESTSASLSELRRRIGVVFQKPALDVLLTVRENLMLHAALQGVPDAPGVVGATASALGVADRLDDRVGTLSGGLTRRVDLARALLHGPELLLLDEPTTGLDHDARMRFLFDLEARREASGLTIVHSTHLMDEAERANVVVLLDEGRVVGDGRPDDLRSELGGAVVRAGRGSADSLREAGLKTSATPGGVMGVATEGEMGAAVSRLAAMGVAFQYGPPTLGDVYVSLTGRSLDGEGA